MSNITSTLGEDIDSALDIIEANGGVGEWEEATGSDAAGAVERWLFPRFAGADKIGTCETHEGIHNLIDKGKKADHCVEFSPDMGNMYLSRSGLGPYDTDVETLGAWLDAPRTVVGCILVEGDPGTGKTALIEAAATFAKRDVLTVLCTPDHTKDSLFLRFVGEGKGDPVDPDCTDDEDCARSPYTLGPIPYAAKHGLILYMDEAMLLVDGVKPVLYSLADGRRFLPEGNVDGSPLEIHPDFRLVLSSNPLVRGASLPEPLASRAAGTTITVETSAGMLRDLGIDESVVGAWEALGTAGLWRPAIRELRVADYWLDTDAAQAVSAFVPEHCPESIRKDVRATVVGYLGGQIREDGRLVVS